MCAVRHAVRGGVLITPSGTTGWNLMLYCFGTQSYYTHTPPFQTSFGVVYKEDSGFLNRRFAAVIREVQPRHLYPYLRVLCNPKSWVSSLLVPIDGHNLTRFPTPFGFPPALGICWLNLAPLGSHLCHSVRKCKTAASWARRHGGRPANNAPRPPSRYIDMRHSNSEWGTRTRNGVR